MLLAHAYEMSQEFVTWAAPRAAVLRLVNIERDVQIPLLLLPSILLIAS